MLCAGGGLHDLDGDGTRERTMPATPANAMRALRWLAELGGEDQAVLVVTNHGGPEGIALWGPGNFLTHDDVAAGLRPSAATKILVLGQCYAGGFADLDLGAAIVCAACGADERAYDLSPNRAYGAFLYHFVGAIGGAYPDGKPLRAELALPAAVTVASAFEYARQRDALDSPRLADPHGLAVRTCL